MKKSFLIFLLSIFSIKAWCADGEVIKALTEEGVEVTYRIISESMKTCQVGTGSGAAVNYKANGSITIPAEVEGYSVVWIAQQAFYSRSDITTISIPNSVTEIDDYAFYECTGLVSMIIPRSVTDIGSYVFSWCSSLSSLVVEEGNTIYDSRNNCNAIIRTADNTLLYGCNNTVIPGSVTSIADWAFHYSGIQSLDIPSGVISIGKYAFSSSALTSLSISNSVTSIASSAFNYCSGLSSIVVDGDNPVFDSRNNCNSIIRTSDNTVILGCKNSEIPDGVERIGSGAFYGNASITSMPPCPSSVTVIEEDAFSRCNGIIRLDIPEGVQVIKKNAFDGCDNLLSVSFPTTIRTIYNYAFYTCWNFTGVRMKSPTPIDITKNTFPNTIMSVGVPFGSKDVYKAASVWKDFDIYTYGNVEFVDANVKAVCVANWDTNGDGELSYEEAEKITDIGNEFKSNTQITSFDELVYFPKLNSINASAFAGCTNLKSLTIPNSVTSIGASAFEGCTSLLSISLPATLTTINEKTFYGCSSLTSISIPHSVKTIGKYVFQGCINLSTVDLGSVESIDGGAFIDCRSLVSLRIPKTLVSFGNRIIISQIFLGCSGITSIEVEEGNPNYFSPDNCNALIDKEDKLILGCKNTVIPNTVRSIDYYALWDANLTSLFIPKSVKKIYGNLTKTGSLTSINVEEGNPVYSSPNNCNAIIDDNKLLLGCKNTIIPDNIVEIYNNAFYECSGLTSVSLPIGVNKIGAYAFYNCSGMTTCTFGSGVTTIGDHAFQGCSGIATCILSSGVTSIGEYAFQDCSGLTSVSMPIGVNSIGYCSFNGCNSLGSVIVKNPVPVNIDKNTFTNRSNIILYVPAGAKNAYEAAPYWKEFKKIIPDEAFIFADTKVKKICVENWDANHDGEMTLDEVIAITDIGTKFASSNIQTFSELQYFSGISYISNNAFSGCKYLTSITIPDGVTSIGDGAFSGCESLMSVNIPDAITLIENSTFFGCSSLLSITLPEGVTGIGSKAFEGCSGLKMVLMSNQVTSIGDRAFYGCNLKSLTLSSSLLSIGSSAFYRCPLTSLMIPNSVISIGDNIVSSGTLTSIVVEEGNTVYDSRDNCNALIKTADNKLLIGCRTTVIPNSIVVIGDMAFAACTGLISINIPEGVTQIGKSTFSSCSDLTAVSFPNTLTLIEAKAFRYCTNLTSLTLPNSLTFIDSEAFEDCRGLTSVSLPKNLDAMGDMAFANCSSLTSVVLPNGLASGKKAFANCTDLTSVTIPEGNKVIPEGIFYKCSYMTSVTLPNSLEIVNGSCFELCTSLKNITLPNRVTYIGPYAFRGCTSLESVNIPPHVTNIYSETFRDCKLLTSITIPSCVETIDYSAFEGCTSLISVRVENRIPIELKNQPFSNCHNATLYVPIGCKKTYSSAKYWKDFQSFVGDKEGTIIYTLSESDGNILAGTTIDNELMSLKFGYSNAPDFYAPTILPYDETFKAYTKGNGVNGDKDNGTFYIFSPKRNGMLTICVKQAANKALFVEEDGIVLSDFNGIIKEGPYTGTYSFEVKSHYTYKVYCNESQLGFYGYKFDARDEAIIFESSKTKDFCIAHWDTNGDGELSLEEAEMVTDLANMLGYLSGVSSFNEFRHFTGITSIPAQTGKIYSAKEITLPASITEIGAEAINCPSLTSIIIPRSVASIDVQAFSNCRELETIKVEKENAIYDSRNNCNGIIETASNTLKIGFPSTVIPKTVTTIGRSAFKNSFLKEIVIPKNIQNIEDEAFYCDNLTKIYVEWIYPITISSEVFDYVYDYQYPTLYVPIGYKDNYTVANVWKNFRIEEYAGDDIVFADEKVKNVCVAKWDLNEDGELGKLEAAQVMYLGDAFQEHEDITSFDELRFFTGLETIGENAFFNFNSLTSITIPKSIYYVSDRCPFGGCNALTSLKVDEDNKFYDSRDNCNAIIETLSDELVAGCSTTVIPHTVITIGRGAFSNLNNLTEITIPNNVITIKYGAFCYSGLTSITIPASVTTIEDAAFNDGKNTNAVLTSVIVERTTPLAIEKNTFSRATYANATLYVPVGCKAAYEAAQYWQDFKEIKELAPVSPAIAFVDPAVKALCLANWDTNNDGQLSEAEAAAVTTLGEVFKYNEEITSFNELQYFTGLTDIADHAFAGCTALTSVVLPGTVTHIYDAAFEGCSQLKSIDFNGCKAAIHSMAFLECRSLTSLVLPAGCYPDGYSVFNGCSALLSVEMKPCDNPIDIWSSDVFAECNNLKTATVYGRYLHGPGNFRNCSSLTTVTYLDDIPGNSFNQNFQGVPADVQFVIPDGSAETFLHNGYFNLSDKSGLGVVSDEFEAEAERVAKIATTLTSGDATTLQTAISVARTVVNSATDYADVLGQIDVIKQAARDFLATNELADEVDVTGAYVLNPDFDRFDRGWQAPTGWITSGYQDGHCKNGEVVIDKFIQIWHSEWIDDHDEPRVLDDYKLSQTIRQLPAGNYRLEADCIASWSTDDRDITGAYLFISDEQVPVATQHAKPQHYTVDFTISETCDVEIGMKTFNTNVNWIATDNFRLYCIYPSNDPTALKGDVNGDGEVTYADAVAILNYLLSNQPSDFNIKAADVNQDKQVTITDAVGVVDIIQNDN